MEFLHSRLHIPVLGSFIPLQPIQSPFCWSMLFYGSSKLCVQQLNVSSLAQVQLFTVELGGTCFFIGQTVSGGERCLSGQSNPVPLRIRVLKHSLFTDLLLSRLSAIGLQCSLKPP